MVAGGSFIRRELARRSGVRTAVHRTPLPQCSMRCTCSSATTAGDRLRCGRREFNSGDATRLCLWLLPEQRSATACFLAYRHRHASAERRDPRRSRGMRLSIYRWQGRDGCSGRPSWPQRRVLPFASRSQALHLVDGVLRVWAPMERLLATVPFERANRATAVGGARTGRSGRQGRRQQ